MDQAIWARLQNAAEATTPGTEAQVALRMHVIDAGLAIDIEDDGAGVPPDAAARIFRPDHTTKPDGTGIGLSLARQIALAHGGTLTLRSGSRTTVRLAIPKQLSGYHQLIARRGVSRASWACRRPRPA